MVRCEMEDLNEVIEDLELRIYNGENKWEKNLSTLLTIKTILRDMPKIREAYERRIKELKERLNKEN